MRRRDRRGEGRAASVRRPDSALWTEVLREAGRNLSSGTTRGVLAAIVFIIVIGGLGLVQTRSVVDIAQRAAAFREAGASVMIVHLEDGIDGGQCDALAGSPGIVASGAIRAGTPLRLAALPSRDFETFEATPGLGAVLRVAAPGAGVKSPAGGIWISNGVASTLGVTSAPDDLPVLPASQAHLSGTFPYPNDGRDPLLGYAILTPVLATGAFDSCWIEVWPDPDLSADLLLLPVLSSTDNAGSSPRAPEVRQLNTTLGSRLDTGTIADAVQPSVLLGAAAAAGLALSLALTRLRRLELAAALHAGLSRASLAHQLLLETTGWILPAIAVTIPSLVWAAQDNNPGGVWPALFPGLRLVILSAILALLGGVIGALSTQERHLFRYFKAR